MSTRTIIEINHDQLGALTSHNKEYFMRFLRELESATPARPPSGVRLLGQRHHSERMKLVLGRDATERSIEE